MNALALLALVLNAPPAPVSALAYRPDGQQLAVAAGAQVVLVNPATGDDTAAHAGFPGRVTAVAYSPAGTLAVASGVPGQSGVVRVHTADNAHADFAAHKDAVYALAFSPDGKTLATAGYDRTIKLWPTGKSKPLHVLTDHSDAVYAVAFSPDGKLLASAAADRAVKVWDVATGKRLYTLGDATDWVYAVTWHPDGTKLAAAGVDKSIRVWEATAAGGKLIRSAFAHEKAVLKLAYSPDGKTLYSAGEDRTVKAWDAAKLTETLAFPTQPESILSMALRPDGKQLAVGRFDGVCQLFDTATGKATLTPVPVKPKPPTLTAITPASGARGRTVRVKLTGSRFDDIQAIETSAPGVRVTAAVGPERANWVEAELAIPTDAPVGPIDVKVRSAAGTSAPVKFVIDRFPAVAETGNTESAHTAQPVALPATLVGALDRAGDGDFFRFDATAGQEIGIQVTAGSKLDPVVTITDDTGKVVASGGTTLGYIAATAGRYAIGIRDGEYRGGADFTYRLHVGPIPVVTSVFPLAVQKGRTANVHLDGVSLGRERTVPVTVPADAGIGSKIAVPLTKVNGETPLGSATVTVGEFPAVVVADSGELRTVPGTADGILARPGDSSSVKFAAKKGHRLVVETHARRLGSPLDPTVELLDATGTPVPRTTLRCTAKTSLTFRDIDSVNPKIRLDAWNELATDDHLFVDGELMRIAELPGHPDADCNFVQVAGRRAAYLGTTATAHAQNATAYKVEFHPPGATFPPNGMPVFALPYRNDDGGPGFGKDAMILFDPPADGVYQARVVDARRMGGPGFAFRLTVRPPRPDYTLSVSPTTPNVWQGGAVPVTVTAARLDGFDGEIAVRPDGLAAPYSAPATLIEAGQTTATFALAAEGAGTATTAYKLVGTATIDGKSVSRETTGGVPKTLATADVSATTDAPTLTLRPGGEARIRMRIERRNGFAGRVPLDVRGLPHGVTVQNIGLNGILCTEKDTEREIVLAAEPWVKPMAVPVVFLARVEKKGTEHAARSVLLKVSE